MSEDLQRIAGLERRVEKIETTLDVLHEIRERMVRLESKIENNLAGNSSTCSMQNTRISYLEGEVEKINQKQMAMELLLARFQGAGWAVKILIALSGCAGGSFVTWLATMWIQHAPK